MSSVLSPAPQTSQRNARESSQSYFGLSIDNGNTTLSSSGARISKSNLGPLSAGIRSNAASPSQSLPFHTNNSEYEAFKREVERKRSDATSASVSGPLKDTHGSPKKKDVAPPSTKEPSLHASKTKAANPTRQKLDAGREEQEAIARSPKRLLSEDSATFPNQIRRESPAPFRNGKASRTGSPPSITQDLVTDSHQSGHPSRSHPDNLHVPSLPSHKRGETLPEQLEPDNPCLSTPQRVVNMLECHPEEVLLLDLRVVTQYSRSRVRGALNLCVPTTLLKRASYNTSKLADTFKIEEEKSKFSRWRHCQYIICYDTNCSQLKEAASCVNILKKFEAEGWTGESCIIKGGFANFVRTFPDYVEQTSGAGKDLSIPNLTLKTNDLSSLPPVIGGCPMPVSKSVANPFFGNIRQNMDLIGGVGQLAINLPPHISMTQRDRLPSWLKKACDESDGGKSVADTFYHIEKREQKRMQEALSGNVTYGTPGPTMNPKVQIAGIEKGAKNRYNNIWPFEHSRVRLEETADSSCDYFNANYIRSSISDKRYIATQGPIPATFEDFWRIVWQQDVRVIVMLTAEKEGGLVKAHNYWDDNTYGPMRLRFLSEHRASLEPGKIQQHKGRPHKDRKSSTYGGTPVSSAPSPVQRRKSQNSSGESPKSSSSESSNTSTDAPYVVVRNFTLANSTKPFERMREITQLHYSSWPDFGAPACPAHLIGLVEQCDAVAKSSSGNRPVERPVLVHCSAGCGRTGTFCTVDSVLDTLKKQRQDRPPSSLSTLRGSSKATSPMDEDRLQADPFFSPHEVSTSERDWVRQDDVDLVEKAVEEFRRQRISMVQSLRQFVLCYETVLEWLVNEDSKETL